ncbi:MAG: hypothetical protein CVU17_01280 [Betaproteobacteria bacterium HGW-Betaproteobacteria-11]|nr:MAG: hypothetical protein CVU17_01280 [Betaproteobacteria bacterium HGW-Betaproteobacteria-11]
MGFDAKFREDIREKCQVAEVTFEHNQRTYLLRRDIGSDPHILIEVGGVTREFFSEGDFSQALFEELDLAVPVLVGSNRLAIQPYLSTVLPIFYVRQDGGYIDPYRPPASFISDQFVEMVRFIFGLNPKHSYHSQRDLIAAKEQLDAIQRRLVVQQTVITNMSSAADDSVGMRDRLSQQSATLTKRIQGLKVSVDSAGAANDALLELLQAKEEQIRATRRQQTEFRARLAGIDSIRGEIEGEIKTLSLNEESKRVFESFFDICHRSDCGLFATSSESYAKNLMYLKDQIKDLEANANRADIQCAVFDQRLVELEEEHALIVSKLNERDRVSSTGQLVSAVQSLTKELVEAEQRLVALDRLSEERRKYLKLDEERSTTQDRIAMLSNHGRSDLEFNKLRVHVRDLTVKWMDILETPNVPREIGIDLDFKFKFGNESIDMFSGSTRNRLILAIHAAIFEAYIQDAKRPFRFLILDTPKQHELASADLAKFLHALEAVCDAHAGQILISATEYRHPIVAGDAEWTPQYPGLKQSMYLGTPKDAGKIEPDIQT